MIRRPPRSTQSRSSAASDVYKRQHPGASERVRHDYRRARAYAEWRTASASRAGAGPAHRSGDLDPRRRHFERGRGDGVPHSRSDRGASRHPHHSDHRASAVNGHVGRQSHPHGAREDLPDRPALRRALGRDPRARGRRVVAAWYRRGPQSPRFRGGAGMSRVVTRQTAAEESGQGLRVWIQKRSVLRLVRFALKYRWQALCTIVAMVAVTATGLAGPYLLRLAIDKGIAGKDLHYLGGIAILYLAAGILGAVLNGLQTYGMNWVGERVVRDLRDSLFRHLTSLDIDYYSRQRAGWIVSRLTNDIEALESLLVEGVAQLVVSTLTLVGATAILFRMDASLAAVTMTVIPVLLAATVVFRNRASRAYGRVRTAVADVSAALQESLGGIRVVQAFRRERYSSEAFVVVNERNRKAIMDTVYVSGSYFPVVEFLSAVA